MADKKGDGEASKGGRAPRQYRVRLKPTHPHYSDGGAYHRGGHAFGREPVVLAASAVTHEIRTDPWLLIEAVLEPQGA
jgi:hypothetical protein